MVLDGYLLQGQVEFDFAFELFISALLKSCRLENGLEPNDNVWREVMIDSF